MAVMTEGVRPICLSKTVINQNAVAKKSTPKIRRNVTIHAPGLGNHLTKMGKIRRSPSTAHAGVILGGSQVKNK